MEVLDRDDTIPIPRAVAGSRPTGMPEAQDGEVFLAEQAEAIDEVGEGRATSQFRKNGEREWRAGTEKDTEKSVDNALQNSLENHSGNSPIYKEGNPAESTTTGTPRDTTQTNTNGSEDRLESAAATGHVTALAVPAPLLTSELLPVLTGKQLAENPAAVYLASLAPGSRRAMRGALSTVATLLTSGRMTDPLLLDWAQLRFQHTAALRATLTERYAPATTNKILAALRGVLKAAWRLELIEAADYQRAADVGGISGETLPAGRSLSPGEIAALIDACQRDKNLPLGARDAAILSLLYGCGLRRAELVALRVADIDGIASMSGIAGVAEGGEAQLSLKVRGKRRKERRAPLVGGAAAALADWLVYRGMEEGPLFVPVRRGGHVQRAKQAGQASRAMESRLQDGVSEESTIAAAPVPSDQITLTALTVDAVYRTLLARAKQASVGAFSPHDFRRTFVGDLLDRGADIVTVQKLAGHANVSTTARYDRRGEVAKRRAAELLHVPYRKLR